MLVKRRVGVAVTVEAEAVKARLDAFLEVAPCAAVALDAGLHAAPVGIIVMAREAIDGPVLFMREIELKAGGAPHEGFPQAGIDGTGQQGRDPRNAYRGGSDDECRMPAEGQRVP
jgi:hypothetical protein